ncbi:CheA signal transduction histidine kinase [Thermoanaerobacter ethanolicus JW 200]|uniref:Chemotaxis protein CheA n=1 Tax=Thermoanaerobacter siderophilus SR4 TaxID=880478 RepID=I8R6C5_9THEO|nr:chemotaxis protein CheA [Thermoanaerobacter siderophilus]EGD52888.1 CheA signal transduction histidine kinase [Thermoanaerobacter ethanolicus JW 200]EIW01125.1 chemotaxis protein histidine kinase-like protein [Thermoanaerobacter siderophilus SR4]
MENNQYIDIFIEESQEHIENLNSNLLLLENDPENRQVIDEIFRSAHTLKGMAATMGFENMNKLAHKMEDVLQEVKNGQLHISHAIMDILFKCVDTLSEMLDSISQTGEDNVPIDELIFLLSGVSSKSGNKENIVQKENDASGSDTLLNVYEEDIIREAAKDNYKAYKITVHIDKGCVMKSARAFIIFNSLDEIGDIINSSPSVEDIEDEKFEDSFTVHIITKEDKESIEKRLLSIAEVNNVEVELINIDLNKEGERFVKEVSSSQSQSFENIKKSQSNNKTSKSVRVDIDRLDNLMNLVSELIIIKTRLEGLEADNKNSETVSAIEYLERITTNLHDAVMKVRMVPVERVFNRFPRMVRDLSYELGKKIILNMYGQDTEVDRTVIDEIGDPLVHLIRNSIDHGIEMPQERWQKGKPEQGTINLRAYHEGNNVIIEVSDDGRGIDIEKVKAKAVEKGIYTAEQVNDLSKDKILDLLFRPGFSTADKVTDISGRGVGLDVVKNKIESLNGSIEILSEINKGTKFIIKLPLTLAIIQALLVKVGDEKFAIPLNSISEIVHKKEEEIHNVQGKEVVLFRGKVIPIIRLNEVLETKKISNNGNLVCVIIKKGENLACCTVDELIGQQEIVIKPLGKYLSNVKVIAGATILGDGQVALIVDANNLF